LDVLGAYDDLMEEGVRLWRAEPDDNVLLLAGRATHYVVRPRGEYVFGVVADAPMRARRGRREHLVAPGRLVAWDPGDEHAGWAANGTPWRSRLIVIEPDGGEDDPLAGVRFPQPVVDDPALVRRFVALHRAAERPSARLEREERFVGWLEAMVDRAGAAPTRRRLRDRDDAAVRRACAHLREHAERDIGLDELAAVAGVEKFRLVRLVRERTGLPPHALQIAHRVRRARRLLEAGETIAATAAATGFCDQSHLHRHFERTLGLTPGRYRALHAR
jgi:AraC-like DNA-binding protein